MKKIIILFVFLLLVAGGLSAGDSISYIKKLYRQAADLEKEEHCRHEIHFNSMLPAVGLQKTRVRFVFESGQKDPEKDPYSLEYDLQKVVVTWNIAASVQYKKEYLYGSRGSLVFFYAKRDNNRGIEEKRYYFKNRKLIRLMISNKLEGKSSHDVKKGVAAQRAGRREASGIFKKASSYQKAFRSLLKVEALK